MANWLARAHAIFAPCAPANDAAPPAAIPKQAAELRGLIPLAFPGIGDTDSAEVLAVACADPEAALLSFRLLAADTRDQAIWGR